MEAIRSGEADEEPAVRLLGRIRFLYRPRCVDALSADAWCVQSPSFKVVDKTGGSWVVVLKQERLEIFHEAR